MQRHKLIVPVVLVVAMLFGTEAALHADDAAGLAALYTSLDGPSWTYQAGWSDADFTSSTWFQAVDACSFQGVVCGIADDEEGAAQHTCFPTEHDPAPPIPIAPTYCDSTFVTDSINNAQVVRVKAINIGGNLLQGALPAEVGAMTDLEVIALSPEPGASMLSILNNQFSGNDFLGAGVPSSWSALTKLKAFIAMGVNIGGAFPTWVLTDCPDISVVRLTGNGFTGTLPTEGYQLDNIISLALAGNPSMTADVSFINALGPATSVLDLNSMTGFTGQFSDMTTLGSMPYLRFFAAVAGHTGFIPPGLSNSKFLHLVALPPTSIFASFSNEIQGSYHLGSIGSMPAATGTFNDCHTNRMVIFAVPGSAAGGDYDQVMSCVSNQVSLTSFTIDNANAITGSLPNSYFEEKAIHQSAYDEELLVSTFTLLGAAVAEDNGADPNASLDSEGCDAMVGEVNQWLCSVCLEEDFPGTPTTFTECFSRWAMLVVKANVNSGAEVYRTRMMTKRAEMDAQWIFDALSDSADGALLGDAADGSGLTLSTEICEAVYGLGVDKLVENPVTIHIDDAFLPHWAPIQSACVACTGQDAVQCFESQRYLRFSYSAYDMAIASLTSEVDTMIATAQENTGSTDPTVYCNAFTAITGSEAVTNACLTCEGEVSTCLVAVLEQANGVSPEVGLLTNTDVLASGMTLNFVHRSLAALDSTVAAATGGLITSGFDLPGQHDLCDLLPDESLSTACNACPSTATLGRCMVTGLDFGQLASVSISNTALSGEIPPAMATIDSLITVVLKSSEISGELPAIDQLTNLATLTLSGQGLENGIPSSICDLTQLRSIDLSNNNLNGTIPSCLGSLTELETLSLEDNQLSGDIPAELAGMSSLKVLNIARNQISGIEKGAFTGMSSLRELRLESNALSLSVSLLLNDLGALSDLSVIDVSQNAITGALQARSFVATVGTVFASLTELNLGSNQLEGTCPSGMLQLLGLRRLDVSQNPLMTGTCTYLSQLTYFSNRGNTLMTADALPTFLKESDETYNVINPLGVSIECSLIVGVDERFVQTFDIDPAELSYTTCTCKTGFYGGTAADCNACLDNADCTTGELIVPSGYFPMPNTTNPSYILPCYRTGFEETSCNPDSGVDYACEVGYYDRLCSRCERGFYGRGRACVQCTSGIAELILAVFVSMFVVVFFFFVVRNITFLTSVATISSALDYIQTTTVLLALDTFIWPDAVTAVIGEAFRYSTVSLNLFTCIDNGSAQDTLDESANAALSFLSPILVVGLCVVALLLGFLSEAHRANKRKWVYQSLSPLVTLVNFLYVPLMFNAMSALQCEDDDTAGTSWMKFSPWVSCDDSDYDTVFALSVSSTIVWGAGIPLGTALLLYYVRDKLDEEICDVLCFNLVRPYKKQFYWFRLVNFGRRLFLVFTLTLLGDSSVVPFLVFVLIASGLLMQAIFRPYKSTTNNVLEVLQMSTVFFTYVAGLIFSSRVNASDTDFLSYILLASHIATLLSFLVALVRNVYNQNQKPFFEIEKSSDSKYEHSSSEGSDEVSDASYSDYSHSR